MENKELLQAWKLSGSTLSFSMWKLSKNITLPINNNEIESKSITPELTSRNVLTNKKLTTDRHVYLDRRVLERLQGEPLSTKINTILKAYFGIPLKHTIEEVDYFDRIEKEKNEDFKKIQDRCKEIKKDFKQDDKQN